LLSYVPAVISGYGGSAFLLAFARTDPVGRLGGVVLGSAGSAAFPAGLSLRLASRFSPATLILNGWVSHEAPSRTFAPAFNQGLDLSRFGSAVRVRREIFSDGGEFIGQFGGLIEHQTPTSLPSATRAAGLAAFSLVRRQRDLDSRYIEQVDALAELGTTEGGGYIRQRSTIGVAFGGNTGGLVTARASYGTIGSGGGSQRERYAIGGFASPLIDAMLDARRVDAPAYPLGSAWGTSFSTYRVGIPVSVLEAFYGGASPDFFKTSLRSYGAEFREHVPSYSVLGTPEIDVLAGFARALDAPIAREWRYYLSVAIRP
jgi:hypothetical protein